MDFISRAAWGHPEPDRPGGYYIGMNRLGVLVQHHTPGQQPTTFAQAANEVRKIRASHVGQGWQDIGYTFLIWDRFVFEGRGFGRTGAHAPGANSTSIGVAFILDGRHRIPTPVEYRTLRELAAAGIGYGYLAREHTITGHRDWVATDCPGELCYAHLLDYWAPSMPGDPAEPSEDNDMAYEFTRRPGGAFPWDVADIDYTDWGGAEAFDFPDVAVGDYIVVTPTRPGVQVVANVFYPSAKQTPAREVPWGKPMRVRSEEAGFVSVLVNQDAAGFVRVIGRAG